MGSFVDGSNLTTVFEQTLFIIPNWKWLTIIAALVLGLFVRRIFRKIILSIKKSAQSENKVHRFAYYFLSQDLQDPLSWVFTGFFWIITINAVGYPDSIHDFLFTMVKVVFSFNFIQLAYQSADAFGKVLTEVVAKTENTLDDQLAPFINKTLKAGVVIVGLLLVLQNFGFNVFSIIAGLGIGGLAIALAAQDTAANVFGSITIILDRPFQVGDLVRVGDTEGIVEDVGFRSTRIRTGYGSVVSIPNAMMAKEKIDNLGARPARRIRHVLGVTYETPKEKLEEFISRIRYDLKQRAEVVPDDITVSLNNLGDFAIQILVVCHIKVTSLSDELVIQQSILAGILDLAREIKVEFAYPTHLAYQKVLT